MTSQKGKVSSVIVLYHLQICQDIVDGAKPTGTVGGQGGVDFPKTAIKDGVYHTGEAAGFLPI